MRRAALGYAVGRFGLFLLVALVLWLGGQLVGADLNGLPLLLLAALISSALGFLLFSRQRHELAEALDARQRERHEQAAQRRARLEQES